MGSFDKTAQNAKPNRHEENVREQRKLLEHEQITDNRTLWETLEEGDK